ncbi:hypothetical protein ABIB73_000908 [Bradyrhizobium sp. F1.4.3]
MLFFQQMAVAPQCAPGLDRTLLMQRCDHAINDVVELVSQSP